MAHNYLSNADIYLTWAHSEKMKIRDEYFRAHAERLRAETERIRAERLAEELKSKPNNPSLPIEGLLCRTIL